MSRADWIRRLDASGLGLAYSYDQDPGFARACVEAHPVNGRFGPSCGSSKGG